MINFDKILIVAPISAINGYEDNDKFDKNIVKGEPHHVFNQDSPSLHVNVSPKEHTVSIEFTGKILGERYPELINAETFGVCIDRINNMGIFNLNENILLTHGKVGLCDVTTDVDNVDIHKLSKLITANINAPRWTVAEYKTNGLVLYKTVKSKKYQRRLSIYNKETEMGKKNSTDFIPSSESKQSVLDYFKDMTRFELNLRTMKAIRDALKISDTSLPTVLNAEANPIRQTVLDGIVLPKGKKDVKTLRDFEKSVVLEHFDYNIGKIKGLFLEFYKNRNSVNKTIAVYRELSESLQPIDLTWLNDILDRVA